MGSDTGGCAGSKGGVIVAGGVGGHRNHRWGFAGCCYHNRSGAFEPEALVATNLRRRWQRRRRLAAGAMMTESDFVRPPVGLRYSGLQNGLYARS
jgi:hypothetical protein